MLGHSNITNIILQNLKYKEKVTLITFFDFDFLLELAYLREERE